LGKWREKGSGFRVSRGKIAPGASRVVLSQEFCRGDFCRETRFWRHNSPFTQLRRRLSQDPLGTLDLTLKRVRVRFCRHFRAFGDKRTRTASGPPIRSGATAQRERRASCQREAAVCPPKARRTSAQCRVSRLYGHAFTHAREFTTGRCLFSQGKSEDFSENSWGDRATQGSSTLVTNAALRQLQETLVLTRFSPPRTAVDACPLRRRMTIHSNWRTMQTPHLWDAASRRR
jgi:hypothetical protein